MKPRVRGAAPASPKIRPFGVTLVVFSMRHSLDCALRVAVYFPLGQVHRLERPRSFRASAPDLNDPGLFGQVRQT